MIAERSANKTVLLAEDDQSISDLLCFWLEENKLRVVRAADGQQAVAQAREYAPDLLIIDLHMPFVGGAAAARQIRQSELLRGRPVIFISAYGEKGIELFADIEALGDGPIEYVTKPIDFDYLGELLTKLL